MFYLFCYNTSLVMLVFLPWTYNCLLLCESGEFVITQVVIFSQSQGDLCLVKLSILELTRFLCNQQSYLYMCADSSLCSSFSCSIHPIFFFFMKNITVGAKSKFHQIPTTVQGNNTFQFHWIQRSFTFFLYSLVWPLSRVFPFSEIRAPAFVPLGPLASLALPPFSPMKNTKASSRVPQQLQVMTSAESRRTD